MTLEFDLEGQWRPAIVAPGMIILLSAFATVISWALIAVRSK
jgi:hypothetical protein